MTATPTTHHQPSHPLVFWARRSYRVVAGLFTVGIVLQVFFAGLGVLVSPSYYAWHTTFAHLLELLLLALLVLGVIGRVGWRTFGMSALILVLFGLQYTFMYGFEGPLRALHVVNALALFWLALQLGRGVRELIQAPSTGGEPRALGRRFLVGRLLVGGGAILFGTVVLFGVLFGGEAEFVGSETTPSHSRTESSVGTSVAASAAGEQFYLQNCAGCHGGEGEGGAGPALAGNGRLQDGAFVLERLLNGRGAMPAWEGVLSDEQIAAVGSFIRTSFGNDFGRINASDVAAHE